MIRVHVFVEGQTEETFVRELLREHLQQWDIHLNPILLRTGPMGKGGVSTYGKIEWQVMKKCKEDRTAYVTTMLDFYGLPKDFPGKDSAAKETDLFKRVSSLEDLFAGRINRRHFIPNLMLHEFEALLLSEPSKFAEWFSNEAAMGLQEEVQTFASPEHIDDSPKTAPSRRILRRCPGYEKPLHGSLIALDIGLDTIRKRCTHFNRWLEKLESLGRK